MRLENIVSVDGYVLSLAIFEIKNAKGVVQVIHGMEEHKERYFDFAKFLNIQGYTAVISDMRGHGTNAPTLGFFAPVDGARLLIKDQIEITKFIKNTFNPQEIVLFGHSMGTIISRNLLMTRSADFSKVILTGYPRPERLAGLGVKIARFLAKKKGVKAKSKFLTSLSIGKFNKQIKNPKTDLDWLSYNEQNIKNYKEDPLCGFGFTVSGYKDLFKLTKNLTDKSLAQNVKKDLPILLLRGLDDPCVGKEKGNKASIAALRNVGFDNIIDIPFEHMRHEMLNEKDRSRVLKPIRAFLKN